LDQCVEQDAVEAPVAEPNAVPVMLKKGVHGTSSTVVNADEVTPSTLSARVFLRRDIKGEALG
jgi:hypothetical protein